MLSIREMSLKTMAREQYVSIQKFAPEPLAQHGRVRTWRAFIPMPRPGHRRQQALLDEIGAWQTKRNRHHAKADWRFTTETARIKLKRLYLHFE
jgi:hypothetical protein